jgi:hypothetical protein
MDRPQKRLRIALKSEWIALKSDKELALKSDKNICV